MTDIETNEIQKLLNVVAAKITVHNEFKKVYDEQHAFDFNIFNFNRPGENKISEILAYFLDPKQSHGQSKKFLERFIDRFFGDDEYHFDYTTYNIQCEKTIINNRRIDIYMEIGDRHIAIENKIWAVDQNQQLHDYSQHLKSVSSSKFTLLYLNPYGRNPAIHSIADDNLKTLSDDGKLKIISYANDIFPLLDDWISVCKADNVTYFIKQFKQYLISEIIGSDTLTMANILEKLIYENREETEALISAYNEIDNNRTQMYLTICEVLKESALRRNLNIVPVKPYRDGGVYIYKEAVKFGSNTYWIQLLKRKLDFEFHCYLEESNDPQFNKFAAPTLLVEPIPHFNDKDEIIALFEKEVKKAQKVFEDFESASHII